MRCRACDCELKDNELNRRGLFSKEHVDLCDPCFETVKDDIPLATGNESLDESLREDYGNIESDEIWESDFYGRE